MRLAQPTLIAALALTLTLPAIPAEPNAPFGQNPQPSTTPTIHVYSRETIVDVLVTDDKGQPVRGLTKSDFTVEEDGKPQPIRSFYEYDKTTPPIPAPTLPPDTYTNATTLPVNGPVQIFLFDRLGTQPAVMQRAKQYIADYFRSMPAGTQVALFELSPTKGLALLQGFTSDGGLAAAAVDKLDVEWDPPGMVVRLPIAIAGLNQIAAYVAGIHGRKNLIWIVPGSPVPILHDGGYAWGLSDMIYVHQLMDIYDVFTREQIAVSMLDPRGVHGLSGSTLMAQAVIDQTGGAPLGNSNDLQGAIAEIVDYSAHGYTLSYVPTRPDEDAHFHPIKITVNRPGLHLGYRNGYNDEQTDPPNAELIHNMIQGPMRLGAIPATQVLFDLHVSPSPVQPDSSAAQATKTPVSTPKPSHAKSVPCTALFTFDPTQIALTEAPDGTRTANLELDLGAFDSNGTLAAARSQTFKLTVTPAQYTGFYRKPINLTLAIDLPHGQLTLRAGIFDTAASKAGTLEIPLTISKK